ncbi:MAG: peptidoglycan-binding protein [Clostridiales bacterium]|nr:peptidoglycan-binding protein [Clostridiales bacterium]
MASTVMTEYIETARRELEKRSRQTVRISDQIARGDGGSLPGLVRTVAILAVLWFALVWSILNWGDVLAKLPPSISGRVLADIAAPFGLGSISMEWVTYLTLLSLCLYMTGFLVKHGARMARVLRREKYVRAVQSIHNRLQQSIDDMENISSRVSQLIASSPNTVLKPEFDFDGEISRYARIAEAYQAPKEQLIDSVLLLLHVPAALLFSASLLYYATPMVEGALQGRVGEEFALVLMLVFLLLYLLLFLVIQMSFFKRYALSLSKRSPAKTHTLARLVLTLALAALLFYHHGSVNGWFAGDSPVHQLREIASDTGKTPLAEKPEAEAISPYREMAMRMPILRRGDKGPDVGALQGKLNALAAIYPELTRIAQDEDFGGITEGAVKAFQKKMEMEEDGVVDEDTWEKILEALQEGQPEQ